MSVNHILWHGSFYEFRRIIERLEAMISLYERTRDSAKAIPSDLTEREEIIVAMLRNLHQSFDVSTLTTLLSRILGNDEGRVTIDKRALAVLDVGVFHYRSTLTVAEAGTKLIYKHRDPIFPEVGEQMNG